MEFESFRLNPLACESYNKSFVVDSQTEKVMLASSNYL